jgi:hypothetical protein
MTTEVVIDPLQKVTLWQTHSLPYAEQELVSSLNPLSLFGYA